MAEKPMAEELVAPPPQEELSEFEKEFVAELRSTPCPICGEPRGKLDPCPHCGMKFQS